MEASSDALSILSGYVCDATKTSAFPNDALAKERSLPTRFPTTVTSSYSPCHFAVTALATPTAEPTYGSSATE